MWLLTGLMAASKQYNARWPMRPISSLQTALYLVALSLTIFSSPITYAGKDCLPGYACRVMLAGLCLPSAKVILVSHFSQNRSSNFFPLTPFLDLSGAKSQVKLETFEDLKVFKKFLRTKTNVLVLFSKDEASIKPASSLLNEVALATKGDSLED